MMSTQGGFAFNNFLGTSALGDMREDIDELDDRALFTDGTKSMKGTLGMGGNLIVGFTAIEGQELALGILPATGHVSIYAKTDKNVYIQDDTGLETNITGGGTGLIGVTDGVSTLLGQGSGVNITSATGSTYVGLNAGNTITSSSNNSLFGEDSGTLLSGGVNNMMAGFQSGNGIVTGSNNLILGGGAGSAMTNGVESNNIILKSPGAISDSATTRIGDTQLHCFIAGIGGVTPSGTPVACIIDPLTGEMGAGQVQMNGSGDMSMVNSMDLNGSGQILLQTSQSAVDAIKLNATSGGIQIDATGLVNLTSTNANTQALSLVAANANAGILISSNTGGIETTSSGPIDIVTSVNSPGIGITIRSTGINGRIELDAGIGGVRIVDSGAVGFFMEDSSSLFAIQFAIPTMTSDYKLTYPAAQGTTDGQSLVNDSSGNLRWDNPVSAFPEGWINGLGMADNSDTQKNIAAGQCRDFDNTFNIVNPSTLTIDITTNGINGLDTGSDTANTWYALFVIADTSGSNAVASLASLSKTAPTLPGTHDVFRRVGWARLDGSLDFYSAFYGQNGLNRATLWNESEVVLEVLTNGSATSFTVVDCSEFIPPTPTLGYLNTNHFASDEQDFLTLAPVGLTPDLEGLSAVSNPRVNRTFGGCNASGGSTGSTFTFINFNDSTGEILYGNSSVTEDSDIWIVGFQDTLNN